MKKVVLTAFAAFISAFAMAGGVLTNTNQNAAYLRHMSQDAIIDINGLYMNPAGTAFLKDGWHLNVSLQNAKQSRDIITTFPLFQYNVNNRNATHEFEGDAYAPVIPGFMLSYNHGKWS
ncbi:transporter, partial [bacterium]|nr:transporter [bacterium]